MEQSFEMPEIDSKQPCEDHPINDNQESSGLLPDGDPNESKESDVTEESCQCCHVSYYFLANFILQAMNM